MNHYSRTTGKVPRLGAIIAASVVALMSFGSTTASAGTHIPAASSAVVVPAPNEGASPPIAVSWEHACALPGDGTVRCWGLNYYGELGDGTQTDPSIPAGDTLPLVAVTVISGPGSSTPLTDVTAIAAGLRHTCAVLADGTVKCWGWNSRIDEPTAITGNGGQVGDGTTTDRLAPVTVIAAAGSTDPLSGVRAVTAGWFHTCALMLDDTVKCWGTNEEGQLGDGTTTNSTAPVTVIAATGSSSPLSNVIAIAAGDFRTCALLADTTVTCWGWNYVSQLSDSAGGPGVDVVPLPVDDSAGGALSGVTAIAVAYGFTQDVGGFLACALMTTQRVKCWGANDFGSLGDGTTTSSLAAVDVVGLPGTVTAITGGCALLADTTVSCWPNFDVDGQLVNAPALVKEAEGSTNPLTSVTAIAAGGSQICAVLVDGSVTCWSGSIGPVTVLGLLVTAPAATPAPTATSQPTATAQPTGIGADSLAGDWSVTYGSRSVVTISGSNGSYTVTAKSPVRVTGSACDLPPGTLIATFSGSGGSYTGQHGLWHTSDCSFANWASVNLLLDGNSLAAVLADGERAVFTRIGPAPVVATTPPSFRESVATPAEITLDPVIIAQGIAIVAGFVILIPFPSTLFNSTLEANYDEIVGKVRRGRRRLGRLFALPGLWARRRLQRPPIASAAEPQPAVESGPDGPTDSQPAQTTDGRFWKTPLGIMLFLLLSALLIGFLDPTFGLDLVSLATFAGLAAGLVVTLLAFDLPIALAYRRVAVPFSVRALPGTLAVGLVCVLVTRLTDFHPGYIYGLVVALIAARELSVAVQGKVMMQATIGSIVVAVVAWFGLWWVDTLTPAQGDPGLALVAVQTALAMAVAAGVELTVFGMVPVRFLAGESIFRWNRRVWAVLFAIGLLGFTIILMNPSDGYLADATRTPLLTIVVLLLGFGLGSVVFWAYFRFRRAPAAP